MDTLMLIVTAVAVMMLYKAYNFYLFYQRVNKLPGPKHKIPLLGNMYELMMMSKEDSIQRLMCLSNQYKDGFVKIWVGTVPILQIRRPEHIEVLLRSNTQIMKTTVYKYMESWLGKGLLTASGAYEILRLPLTHFLVPNLLAQKYQTLKKSEFKKNVSRIFSGDASTLSFLLRGPHWFHSRKLITPTFHFSKLYEFSEVMIEKVAIFNRCIEREIREHGDEPFDIYSLAGKCTLDIICETAMGVDVHVQEEAENEYIKTVHTIGTELIYRVYRPWLKPDWLYFSLPSGKNFKKAVRTAQKICTNVIKRKQRIRELASGGANKPEGTDSMDHFGRYRRKAFLDLLLEINEKEDSPMSITDIEDQVNTFMFAGHDTVAVLIAWALFRLGNELDVQRKVHEELDEVLDDLDDQATLKQLPNLRYLDRVIKEVLRLYPSAPIVSRRTIEDVQIGDYTVPEGVIVDIQIYHLHRDSSLWPNPLRFDPDRFLPENIKGRHPYVYVPFSAGPRNCIGMRYAILEAKVVLAQVLRRFCVKSLQSPSEIKAHFEVTLKPVDGVYVHMSKRSKGQSI